mmetsp:Transcript_119364/g.216944  ORF Transcript_119364/g.216944 Transcript_119364/m.216944 type:complete len:255 (-) Transcript_119364:34-798(-)
MKRQKKIRLKLQMPSTLQHILSQTRSLKCRSQRRRRRGRSRWLIRSRGGRKRLLTKMPPRTALRKRRQWTEVTRARKQNEEMTMSQSTRLTQFQQKKTRREKGKGYRAKRKSQRELQRSRVEAKKMSRLKAERPRKPQRQRRRTKRQRSRSRVPNTLSILMMVMQMQSRPRRKPWKTCMQRKSMLNQRRSPSRRNQRRKKQAGKRLTGQLQLSRNRKKRLPSRLLELVLQRRRPMWTELRRTRKQNGKRTRMQS